MEMGFGPEKFLIASLRGGEGQVLNTSRSWSPGLRHPHNPMACPAKMSTTVGLPTARTASARAFCPPGTDMSTRSEPSCAEFASRPMQSTTRSAAFAAATAPEMLRFFKSSMSAPCVRILQCCRLFDSNQRSSTPEQRGGLRYSLSRVYPSRPCLPLRASTLSSSHTKQRTMRTCVIDTEPPTLLALSPAAIVGTQLNVPSAHLCSK